MKHLILYRTIEKNKFKDILFDYDMNDIRPDAGAAPVSMKEHADMHAVTGGHCFSEPCYPLIRGRMPGES